MKKINLTSPYIIVEEVDESDTKNGLIISSSKEGVDIFLGKVINSFKDSDIKPDDYVLFVKQRAYRFIDEAKEYYIISQTEDVIGKLE